jgi:hypothetical protein
VSLVYLAFQAPDEFRQLGLAEDPSERPISERLTETRVSGEHSEIEHGRCRRQIVASGLDEVGRGRHLMPDVHTRVPQRIEERFGKPLRALRRFVRDEAHVEVALPRE